MKPPNHGLRVRVTTSEEDVMPGCEFEGWLALDPLQSNADNPPDLGKWRGLVLLEGEWLTPLHITTTDRIEMLR